MSRRRLIPAVLLSAAALAAAMPIIGAAAPDGAVLPDLVADPPAFPVLQQYTYPDATQALLLRFDGYVHNIGPGPLEIRGSNRSGAEFTTVRQYVQTPTGMQATDPPTAGKYPRVIYETQDAHNHFHLQRIARYSLWNEALTAEVAPGQKVGFCLEDTQRVTTNGPANPVYENLNFCHQGDPTASSIQIGISAGWRDRYGASLAMQWVDVSDVQPGVYRLASEIDTDNVITEQSEANNTRAYAAGTTTIPGYRALAVNAGTIPGGQASTLTFQSQTVGSPGARRFRIQTLPAGGTLRSGSTVLAVGSTITGNTVTYTPSPGSSGPDDFTYAAQDSTSLFPRTPAPAAVSLTVGQAPAETTVVISGAPTTLNMGTSAQLTATVTNGAPGVTWSVNGVAGGNGTVGTISTGGLYEAPAAVPAGGSVTIRATSTAAPSAFAQVAVQIVDPGPVDPAPTPGTNHVTNPSFETDLSGWSTWQASLSRVQLGDAPAGVTVARVARTAGTSFTLDDVPTSVTAATAGSTYTGSAFVKSAGAASLGKTVRVHLRERTAAGATIRTINGPTVALTNSFQRVSAQVTPQSAGSQIEIYLAHLGATSGSAFYVDQIALTNGEGGPPANQAPIAQFGASTLSPQVGQTVTFTDQSTDPDGSIATRAWDLDGDGQYDDGRGATATHSYPAVGTVTVRLRVTDNAGAPATAARAVTVSATPPPNQPPTASFTASTLTPQVGQTVTFTDESTDSDGTIGSRAWDLDGDGDYGDATGPTATHAYTAAGTVTVRLRVADDDGAQATTTRSLTVSAAPGPGPGGPNLVVNGSFETNVAGWTTWQASLLRTALADAPAGAYAVKVTRTAGTAFTLDDSPTTVAATTAGATYRGSAAVKAASASSVGKPVELFFRERSPSGATLRTVAGPTLTVSNTFQVATVELVPLATGNQLEIYIGQKSGAAGNALYVDDVQMKAG